MNVLVIGASEESIHSIEVAKKMGYTVIALDGDRFAPGLKKADIGIHVDINDLDNVYRIVEQYNPKMIVPVPIGRALCISGSVNEKFNLPGIMRKTADLCTDKWQFHKIMRKNGLRDNKCFLIDERLEKRLKNGEIVDNCSWIVKPNFGAGSRDVEAFSSLNMVNKWMTKKKWQKESFLLEECVEGCEYGIDGMYVNGEFHLILLRKKINTEFPFRQCIGYMSVLESEDKIFIDKCKELFSRMGHLFQMENAIMDADIIKDKNGDPFVIEFTGRPSGHMLTACFNKLCTGFDTIETFISICADSKDINWNDYSKVKKLGCFYFALPIGTIKDIPSEGIGKQMPYIVDYRCNLKVGDVVNTVINGSSIMGRGFFIVNGNSENDLLMARNDVLSKFIVD